MFAGEFKRRPVKLLRLFVLPLIERRRASGQLDADSEFGIADCLSRLLDKIRHILVTHQFQLGAINPEANAPLTQSVDGRRFLVEDRFGITIPGQHVERFRLEQAEIPIPGGLAVFTPACRFGRGAGRGSSQIALPVFSQEPVILGARRMPRSRSTDKRSPARVRRA